MIQNIEHTHRYTSGWLRKINIAFALSFVFLLPFNTRHIGFILFLWCLTSILISIKNHIHCNSLYRHAILFWGFYAISLISLCYSENMTLGIRRLETMATMIFMPFLIFILKQNSHNTIIKEYLFRFYIGGLLSYIFVSIAVLFFRWDIQELIEYFANRSITYATAYSRLSFLQHRSYISLYMVWGIVLICSRMFKTKSRTILYCDLVLVASFSLYITMLGSRGALLTLLFVINFYIWKFLQQYSFVLSLFLAVFILGSSSFLLMRLTRIGSTINHIQYTDHKINDNRIPLWESAWNAAKKAPILGHGIGDGTEAILYEHKKSNLNKAFRLKANAHNQFLETSIQLGILGLLSLIALFLIPFVNATKRKDEHMIIWLLIVLFNLMFESMLVRLAGVLFIAFWLSYMLIFHDKKIPHIKTENVKSLN